MRRKFISYTVVIIKLRFLLLHYSRIGLRVAIQNEKNFNNSLHCKWITDYLAYLKSILEPLRFEHIFPVNILYGMLSFL